MRLGITLQKKPKMISNVKKIYIGILVSIIFLVSCAKKKSIMRNLDVSIIVLDKVAYEKDFKKLTNSINLQSFQEITSKMKDVNVEANEIMIAGKAIRFGQIYKADEMSDLHKIAFKESVERYEQIQNDSELRSQLDFDVLQPLLYYTSSRYFKDKFYLDLAYHPPFELSKVFEPFFKEFGAAQPTMIELVNPYAPMMEHIFDSGGIYYVALKPELLIILQQRLEQMVRTVSNAKELECDVLFLKEIIESGIKNESLIIMQVMP